MHMRHTHPSALKGFQREKDDAKLTIFYNIAKEETIFFESPELSTMHNTNGQQKFFSG